MNGFFYLLTSPSRTSLNCIVSGVAAASGTVSVMLIIPNQM